MVVQFTINTELLRIIAMIYMYIIHVGVVDLSISKMVNIAITICKVVALVQI